MDVAQTQQSRPKAALRRLPSTRYGQYRAMAGTIPVAVTAKVASVEVVKFTGSPPFDVDGTATLAQRGRRVNIGDLPRTAAHRFAKVGGLAISQGRPTVAPGPIWLPRAGFPVRVVQEGQLP